jgi:ketosteroid isomerase-like protein
MKTCLIITLLSLSICFVTPAQAFSGDLAGDVNALEELNVLASKYEDAYNTKNAAALAALFTDDAVCVTPAGLVCGRQAIERESAAEFQRWPETSHVYQTDRLNAFGGEISSAGQWWRTLRGQSGLTFARGFWSALLVRESDGWKLRMLTFNESLPLVQSARVQ